MGQCDDFAMAIKIDCAVLIVLDWVRDGHEKGSLRVYCAVEVEELF